MKIFYLLGIRTYWLLLTALSGFHSKAGLMVSGRKNIWERMRKARGSSQSLVAWFHCASLGEFEQARPVLEGFKVQHPDYKILLTFFSPSGYEVRKGYSQADYIFYLPADSASNAQRLYDIFKPTVAFFVKYEFWHYYLTTFAAKGVKLYSFSAIFRPGQSFFKPWGGFFADMLRQFTHIFVQNEESKLLLSGININNVSISGDTRFDRVAAILVNNRQIPLAEKFKNAKPLLLIGSAWPEDTNFVLPAMANLKGKVKLIIAPHEIKADYIAKLQDDYGYKSITWTQAQDEDPSGYDLLIIDNIGMLSALYRYADYAWVGGAFGKGLHNILEAAVWGLPVMFGHNYLKFQEAVDLIKLGGAFTYNISDGASFANMLSKMLNDTLYNGVAGKVSADYVANRVGATARILEAVKSM